MNFAELQEFLRAEAKSGASGIRSLEGVGATTLRVTLETVPGRLHGVWIRWEGDGDGELVRMIAPCARLEKGHQLTADAATALLRRNASLAAGAIALVTIDGLDHVALVVPMRLGEVDPSRALLTLIRAANAADAFEETLGSDDL